VRRSTPGVAALGACWRARLCTLEQSRACWRAGQGREEAERWGVRVSFSSFLPSLTTGVWVGETGSRQRGERGCPRVLLQELGRTREPSATVVLTFLNLAHNVFDTMSARNKVSNFEIFPVGFCRVMDKDPMHMLVYKIQSLAEI
jgi:hypothetical protein